MAARSAAITTLHARLSLPSTLPHAILQKCLIDPSSSNNENNAKLAEHGKHVIGYYVSDWIMTRFPRLPYKVVKSTLFSYAGHKTLANVGREWGVEAGPEANELSPVIKMVPVTSGSPKEAATAQYRDNAYANFVRSVIGAIHVHAGPTKVHQFVDRHILSRELDILRSYRILQPSRELSHLCAREGLPAPTTLLTAETGRRSNRPVYVQAVYSGKDKLGEGQGSSIKEAKYTAESNALKAWFMFEDKQADLSSSRLEGSQGEYKPAMIDTGDIII